MRTAVALISAVLLGPASPSPAAQVAQARANALSVSGDVAQPLTIRPADLATMPRTTVTVTDEGGRKTSYEGVAVGELLRRAGASIGREMGSRLLTSYVLASASDGYEALFSLAELDSGVAASEIIVADMRDGRPLPEGQGPFRLVAPQDKRAVRAVRALERLQVVQVKK